ncbi:hypothetical protein [Oceanirhabdus sp. W0125-5]|uniref:hypothetical protein n=1 Tax=Oceanirhabdus sp. W0125-5 TaxID=2999116 RepID=UPI0022F318A9|nr:hypothetical protein [Oceanirhabdus sp. W0125-5]WBW95988.1 hypothetical protein OW730_20180 [Oceanirhabdus sp. W0125-5]
MKKRTFFTFIIIIFWIIADFSISIFAQDFNVNPVFRALAKGLLTGLCIYIYFNHGPKIIVRDRE